MSPEDILRMYRHGYFPMANDFGEIGIYSYNPRAILPLEGFRVPRRMARELRACNFEIRINTDFQGVIRGCAQRSTTWISEEIIALYQTLHQQGHVHTVEAWQGEELVGGLYGVSLGGAFCGESMFHRKPSASKACLVALVEILQRQGYGLLDCQAPTAHTERFGVRLISLEDYLTRLREVLPWQCNFAG